jgi:hypothetical protein
VSTLTLCAWTFVERPKDYGGIHLGVWRRTASILHQVIAELSAADEGFSRRLPLRAVPAQLPTMVFTRGGYVELAGFRIGSAAQSHIAIDAQGTSGSAMLDRESLAFLDQLVTLAEGGRGDVCVCGHSEQWHDRLWVWPAD